MSGIVNYFSSLPGAISLGLIWAIMAVAVYITYKILNVADLTVDGSFATGGIVAAVLITNGVNFGLALLIAFLAGLACGLITGLLHTFLGIPAILAGILTQMALWSINLKISGGKSNVSISAMSSAKSSISSSGSGPAAAVSECSTASTGSRI